MSLNTYYRILVSPRRTKDGKRWVKTRIVCAEFYLEPHADEFERKLRKQHPFWIIERSVREPRR